jgi:hypothetical protein
VLVVVVALLAVDHVGTDPPPRSPVTVVVRVATERQVPFTMARLLAHSTLLMFYGGRSDRILPGLLPTERKMVRLSRLKMQLAWL